MGDSRSKTFTLVVVALMVGYLAVALPLSILAIYATLELGLSNFLGGFCVSASFLVTLTTRRYSGAMVDRIGGKAAFIRGGLCYAMSGLLGIASTLTFFPIPARFAILILGRVTLGFGEAMLNNGVIHWGVAIMGLKKSGRVLATLGMCMYGTVAFGGLLGYAVYGRFGFTVLMALCCLAPLCAVAAARRISSPGKIPPPIERGQGGEPFFATAKRIWKLGAGVCLQGVGNAVLGAFLVQTFLTRNWPHAGWAVFCFGCGFVLLRVVAGHFPDRVGGVPVAAASLSLEMIGLYTLWLAGGPLVALCGAFLVGAGCSMTYPALGREVLIATPKESYGTAMGCYSAFQDLALGTAGPIAGLLADRFRGQSVFLFAALAATLGLVIMASLLRDATRS